ncbi:hypothetical protein KI387_041261, partial [Taxus chinensis]
VHYETNAVIRFQIQGTQSTMIRNRVGVRPITLRAESSPAFTSKSRTSFPSAAIDHELDCPGSMVLPANLGSSLPQGIIPIRLIAE